MKDYIQLNETLYIHASAYIDKNEVVEVFERASHQHNSPPPFKKKRNNSLQKLQQKAKKVRKRRKK